MKIKLFFTIFFAFYLSGSLSAAHLVGGEMSYKCVGNNNYEISLTIYRDCFSQGAPFDPWAIITIYKQNGILYQNDSIPFNNSIRQLPNVAPNNCTVLPQTVCTEKGTYTYTIHLPPTQGGYTITHQRCCRNNTITNINNGSSQWGSTFTIDIPSNDVACNSSPKYKDDPPVVLCLDVPVELDLSVIETDGDSVFYELCSVLNGGANSAGLIAPNPASPPPYLQIPFIGGFSSSNPIASNPGFTINPVTGQLSGKPNMVGQFVFAICANEYRNGVLLSTNRRDFQFNVSPDCETLQSKIRFSNGSVVSNASPSMARTSGYSTCNGTTLNISNAASNVNSYYWDFGDITTTTDTSRVAAPTYTYPDTGSYTVMLVVEPYTSCADTSYAFVSLYDQVVTNFGYNGELCFENHSINLFVTSSHSNDAIFNWDFGGNTNLGTNSSVRNPTGVVWDQVGAYYVKVTVEDFGCTGSFGDTLYIYPNPIAGEIIEKVEACLPYTTHFLDDSYYFGNAQHFWDFGDGTTSNFVNPTHTYKEPGTYTVTHTIKSLVGCIDSSISVKKDVITVRPVPTSGMQVEPEIQSIYNPVFTLTDESENHTTTITYLPNNEVIENLERESISIEDTGVYPIYHVSFNEFGCADTLIKYLEVYSPFNLYIPNAFTPNGDGINDEFAYAITGVVSSYIEIYNRWGEIVFKSADPYETWNGRINNSGPEVVPGVYTYVIKAEVERDPYTHTEGGVISVIR